MKNKIVYLIVGLYYILAACSDDKGNYSYTDINQVTMTNQDEYPSFFQLNYGDVLKINPKLESTLGHEAEYKWTLIPNPPVLDKETNLFEPGVVLSTELNLEATIDILGDVVLLFDVTDEGTGHRTEFRWDLKVLYENSPVNSMMVLHYDPGKNESDFDLIQDIQTNPDLYGEPSHTKNYFFATEKRKLRGKGVAICSPGKFPLMSNHRTLDPVVVTDEGDGGMLSRFNLTLTRDFNSLLYEPLPAGSKIELFSYTWQAGARPVMVVDGKCWYGDGKEGGAAIDFKAGIGGNYYADKYAAFNSSDFYMWDKLNHTIKYMKSTITATALSYDDAAVLAPTAQWDTRKFDENLELMGWFRGRVGWSFTKDIMIMRDVRNGDKFLYAPSVYPSTTFLNAGGTRFKMDLCEDIRDAEYFTLSSSGPVNFYATRTTLYQFFANGTGGSPWNVWPGDPEYPDDPSIYGKPYYYNNGEPYEDVNDNRGGVNLHNQPENKTYSALKN